MLPPSLRSLLGTAQIVAVVTLARSIAFDRWWTVVVAALLLAGATTAKRGRTWGLALALTAATAFPVAWAIGIAPPWFALVGIVGIRPFVEASPALARFDRRAAALLAALATTIGATAAIVWKYTAVSAFAAVPLLRPSLHPHHGWAVAALLAVSVGAAIRARRRERASAASDPRVRIAELGETTTTAAAATLTSSDPAEELDLDEPSAQKLARRVSS